MVFYTIIAVGVIGFLFLFFIYALYYINRSTIKEFVEPPVEAMELPSGEAINIIDIEGIGPICTEKLKTFGIPQLFLSERIYRNISFGKSH